MAYKVPASSVVVNSSFRVSSPDQEAVGFGINLNFQNPLVKEYTLHYGRIPNLIQGPQLGLSSWAKFCRRWLLFPVPQPVAAAQTPRHVNVRALIIRPKV